MSGNGEPDLDAEWASIAKAETRKYLDDEYLALKQIWPEVERTCQKIEALQRNIESGKVDRWELTRIINKYDITAVPLIIEPEDSRYFE
ncbi:hypothetical protein [Glycomyces sp. MUSA5-2]|uniref:hypothetical protein n=1 Tax=Glycomyces sp. MUSA5-2 TaxID=2053002 RepID=UPI00300B6464